MVRGTTYSLFANGTALLTNQSLRNYGAFNPLTSQPALPFNPYTQPNFLFFGDATDQASANFSLNSVSVNNFPVAANDTYTVLHDKVLPGLPSVLSNDTDANGDLLTATLVTGPTKGKIFLNPAGDFTYTPNPGFVGTDSFTYTVSDGTDANTVPATVNINVTNSAPLANPDTYNILHDKPLSVAFPLGVLSNDTDADFDFLSATLVTGPTKGTIAFNASGDFTYTPKAGFVGTDTFTYNVTDGAATVPATVTINVTSNPPIAQPDNYTTANKHPPQCGRAGSFKQRH
ncbi:MAG: tandem-95 repeat protein [Oscillatoriales cyanobacterium RU_3_3]|nr:tandem-95 repeat protein [Oscillatoriales cyanobacterium RU_3_3]